MPGSDFHDSVAALKPWLNRPIRVTPDESRRLKALADAGDEAARAELTQACLPYALKLAREYHSRTGLDLDECISIACFGCVECVRLFDPTRGTLLTFVNCRMRSLLPEARRKSLRGAQSTQGAIDFDQLVDARPERAAIAEAVQVSLAQLPPRLRAIAELHYLEGLSYAEIGRRIGLTRERVRQLAVRATRWLKRELESRVEGRGVS
ncbi:MAG TPA: sigma-70 family RNA polymerase sigma factor [Pirellulales bacterium]